MAKLTIKNKFGIAPTELLNCEDLTFKAKGIFTFMQSKPDGWKFSAKRIAQQSKDGIDGVNSGLQELEKAGYLRREKYQDHDTGHWDIEYILYDEPLGENPVPENPVQENPGQENPVPENPSTYSKIDSSKIDNSKKEVVAPPFINKEEKIIELFEFALDPEFQEWYKKFVKARKETRHKMTEASEILFFGKLQRIDPRLVKFRKEVAIKMIKRALEMSWRTIFPLKESEVQEYMKNNILENRKKIEAKENHEDEVKRKAEAELKIKLNQYRVNLTDNQREEINNEAYNMAKKEKPNMEDQFLQPLIQVAKKSIIAKRLNNEKN